VLIDILSFVRLLLSQQPDNTHGIYHATRAEAVPKNRHPQDSKPKNPKLKTQNPKLKTTKP
jgi:hypothetical protein